MEPVPAGVGTQLYPVGQGQQRHGQRNNFLVRAVLLVGVVLTNFSKPYRLQQFDSNYSKEILKEADSIEHGIGTPDWKLVLCLAFSWMCVVLILVKGIKSSGKASYFLALFPYVVMAVLLVRAVTLPGSVNGILYLVTPQWGELLNPKVWFAAVTQVFYSLAIFLGEIIIYASHSRFRQKVYKCVTTFTSNGACKCLYWKCVTEWLPPSRWSTPSHR